MSNNKITTIFYKQIKNIYKLMWHEDVDCIKLLWAHIYLKKLIIILFRSIFIVVFFNFLLHMSSVLKQLFYFIFKYLRAMIFR